MASLDFTNAYAVTSGTEQESNSHTYTNFGLGAANMNDGTADPTFSGTSGNDVVVELNIGDNTYYGWVSRIIKANGVNKGFYFWSDPSFTDLATATAGANDPDDNNTNTAFILVLDQAYFNGLPGTTSKTVGSSSDPVDAALPVATVPAPTVTITEDANNDGVISGSELSGNVNVTVALPDEAVAGDVLTVNATGNTQKTFVLTNTQINAGQVLTDFTPPAEGGTITVTAYITNAGGQGSSGQDSAVRDTTGPGAPTVVITEDTNNDGKINLPESDPPVDVLITLPSGVVVGDTLWVKEGANAAQDYPVDQDMINSGLLTAFNTPGDGGTITVTAWVTDQAGNKGADGSDSATVDFTEPGVPTVVITEDANNDTWIKASEFSAPVDVTVTVPGGTEVGDKLSVSDGSTTKEFILTQTQITNGVLTNFPSPGEGQKITVTAFLTDKAGNIGDSGEDWAVLDTQAPGAPVVTITEDANNDAVISGSEYSPTTVDVSIALPGNAVAGDKLTVSDGITPQNFTLTAGQISAGVVTTTFAAPAQGATITVTAFVTDQAGNAGTSAIDSAKLDTQGPGQPTVVITEDADNSGVISGSENSPPVNVTVTLPGDAVAGDKLTVSDGGAPQNFILTGAQITAGQVLTTFTAPGNGSTITVTAFVTDQAGNAGPQASDSALMDTAAPGAPIVVITEDANNNGRISAAEFSPPINVTVTLPATAVVGDTLTVSDGNTIQNFVIDAGMKASGVPTSFAPPAEGGTITVTAFVTDAANNPGPSGSDSAILDTIAPLAPTVTITEDANNDAVINGSELSGNVDVSIGIPPGAVPGDVLTVTDGVNPVQTFILDAGTIAGGVLTTFLPPPQGGTITVIAFITDQAGNKGADGSDSAVRDTAGPGAPVVVITEDANNNGVISPDELSGDVDVRVTLPAGAVAGDVLTVSDGITPKNFILSAGDIAAGQVLTTFTPPTEGGTITVTARVTDQVGNPGATGSDSALRELVSPDTPVVIITEDANNDGIINAAELNGDVNVTVRLPANAAIGHVLTVTDGITPQTFVLTPAQIVAGQVLTQFAPPPEGGVITVTAFVTNQGEQGSSQGPSGVDSALRDTTPPTAPAVVITEDSNNDGILGPAELSGDVNVTVTLPAGAAAGDVLRVTDGLTFQTFTLTTAQILANQVLTTFAPPAEGAAITVTAFVTDRGGNAGASASDSALRQTSGSAAPVVVITEDANNDAVIATTELSGNVDVAIALPATAAAGDTLTIKDGLTTQDVVLTSAQVAAGSVLTAFAPPSPGGAITVTAFVTDKVGNVGASGSDSAVREVPVTADAVYSVLLENGDRFYSTDAAEAAKMAEGLNNVFEGARFDSLAVEQGGVQQLAWYQPFTVDWFFAEDGVPPPYECYELRPEMAGFRAAAPGQVGSTYHLYLNQAGTTQLVTQAEAGQLGLLDQGYNDLGAQFATTALQAFKFDAEGYLVANSGNAEIRALVQTLAGAYTNTADAGFIDQVEQDYLERVEIVGIAHGGIATAQELNAAFGTAFF